MSPFWLLNQSRFRTICKKKAFRFWVGLLPVLNEKKLAKRQLGWIPIDYFRIISYSSFKTEIKVGCNNRISCS